MGLKNQIVLAVSYIFDHEFWTKKFCKRGTYIDTLYHNIIFGPEADTEKMEVLFLIFYNYIFELIRKEKV